MIHRNMTKAQLLAELVLQLPQTSEAQLAQMLDIASNPTAPAGSLYHFNPEQQALIKQSFQDFNEGHTFSPEEVVADIHTSLSL